MLGFEYRIWFSMEQFRARCFFNVRHYWTSVMTETEHRERAYDIDIISYHG